jgi:hypothetical protein
MVQASFVLGGNDVCAERVNLLLLKRTFINNI